ncbi:MAG TPA: transporter, partial [Alphaproteobacteria bacterium]|nr:transporter [Alphaproteobacteria bacterium]
VTAALTGRYNLTDRLQVDVKVPWVRRQDSTISRPLSTGASQDAEFTADGSGLGDIEAGAHYQFTDGLGALPILVANVRVKSRTGKDPFEVPLEPSGSDFAGLESELPTGNGFWAVEPSVTAIIPSDPVVFFATAGYQWNIKRTITSENVNSGASTEIDPGDAFKVGMGFGFGINERASFNLGYDHAFVFKSTQNGQDILNSDLQVGTFSTGVAYRLNKNMNMNVSLGIGVTDPAPDAQLMLRIPYKFGN